MHLFGLLPTYHDVEAQEAANALAITSPPLQVDVMYSLSRSRRRLQDVNLKDDVYGTPFELVLCRPTPLRVMIRPPAVPFE